MRNPACEYLDQRGTGQPYEALGRETFAQRHAVDIGRPSPAARAAGRGPDAATLAMRADWRDELAKMKARLEQLQAS